ncbi:conserved protein of unknown function [Methylacidimicrobium sp. AP8]|uniref:type III-B CRISPR-associated protein Cas10/Cmr2 n=1 Tax=Methylacidimicrobium sp. AP8 TaxID=2730359 RepID=UPI0018C04B9B|nr:type III-B CRISPR-associated protein Cas10/Cmr2 [Methylacidimicrobium sp. AP8]CAB4243086.1 conserved protein of unknown function [Methylacidimicrobium sp. AP8]
MNFWQRKLLASLHDPPSKPFNLREHEEIARSLLNSAGFDPERDRWFFDRICDHVAAAADRVLFPKPALLRSQFRGDLDSPFRHPLGGGEMVFENPISPDAAEAKIAECQPAHYDLSRVADRSFPGFPDRVGRHKGGDVLPAERPDRSFPGFPDRVGRDWANFFLHWRLWPLLAARRDPRLAFLPADTRIPDHTVWTHCAVTSSLQGCVEVTAEDPGAEIPSFAPAFLLVQVGPVQEFIAQARSTRDLWSGSYLLSFLVAHGIKAVTDRIGPDAVLYPALRGQPLFDRLHKEELYDPVGAGLWKELAIDLDEILVPNLPNRFLAVVPACLVPPLAQAAVEAIQDCLTEISRACLEWFRQKHGLKPEAEARWQEQVAQFLSLHWQVWPWTEPLEMAIAAYEALPAAGEGAAALRAALDAARRGIPSAHRDPRNYRRRSPSGGEIVCDAEGLPILDNQGFGWSAHYAMVDFLLAARRRTRDFAFWGNPKDLQFRRGATRDVLSGKEESIGDEEWVEGLSKLPGRLFRKGERLGAMNLIKRVWHRAYLPGKLAVAEEELLRTLRYESVPEVAAADWVRDRGRELDSPGKGAEELDAGLKDFRAALERAAEAREVELPGSCRAVGDDSKWLRSVPGWVFQEPELRREIRENSEAGRPSASLQSSCRYLKRLVKAAGGAPCRYAAVLALDGDEMGRWLSGGNGPELSEQLSAEARAYFGQRHPEGEDPEVLCRLLHSKRLLTPSFHLELSTALAGFSLYLARGIVSFCAGQLIYAGGDDLLAMLPAREALRCAELLRMGFRGDPNLAGRFEGVLPAPEGGKSWGFVALNGEWEGWKGKRHAIPRGYHILVPGKRADLSAGIAIGHIHSPLQSLVEGARAALRKAKAQGPSGYGKSAFAVQLLKRSGEILEWGAKWDSSAIPLYHRYVQLVRVRDKDKKLSGRFPYVLAGLLRRYAPAGDILDAATARLCREDLKYVAIRQSAPGWSAEEREEFLKLACQFLGEIQDKHRPDDFLGPFLTAAFLEEREG